MLTDRFIKALRPTSKHQFVADGNGLYLRVQPTGTKTWVYRSRLGGKARWLSLGNYPTLSLLDARRKALELAGSELPENVTFEFAYAEYFKRVASTQYTRPDIVEQRVKANLLPNLRTRALSGITRAELTSLLHTIVDRGAPVMANRTLTDAKHIFNYAVSRGWLNENPAERITRKIVGGKEKPRDVVLSFEAIQSFLKALYEETRGPWGMTVPTAGALYLCLLTGQRASEVLWLVENWAGEKMITLPAKITKISRTHKIQLSVQAIVALRFLRGQPVPKDHRVLSHALRRIDAGFTPHDLRRTMATRLSDLGVAPHVIEKMLNHQMTGVMAVYNRAEYLPERAAAWALWGRKIAGLRRAARRELSERTE